MTLQLLIGLVMTAVLIYISNHGEIMAAFCLARRSYIMLAIPLYPLIVMGPPAPPGVPVALLDRAIGMTGDAQFGGRYAIRRIRKRRSPGR